MERILHLLKMKYAYDAACIQPLVNDFQHILYCRERFPKREWMSTMAKHRTIGFDF